VASPASILGRLYALYSHAPLYLRLFARIRLGHAGYDIVEAALPKGGRLLDLGCGYGLFSNYAAIADENREVVGLELDARKIALANPHSPKVTFKRENVMTAELGGKFDGIVLLHVMHHLESFEQQERLLGRCAELLSPDGVLLILEVEKRPWWKHALALAVDHALYPDDTIFYRDRADMEALLEKLGLNVETKPMGAGRPFPHILYSCRLQAPNRR
jgi:2-polyprenyl-3-methyl-5-hydroxy-6-metoxy-1,4-benzoquinol methylase